MLQGLVRRQGDGVCEQARHFNHFRPFWRHWHLRWIFPGFCTRRYGGEWLNMIEYDWIWLNMIEYDWWFIRMDWSWVVPPAWHRPCSLVALPCPSLRNWSSTWCLQSVLLCRPWKFCCYQRHLDLEGHFTMGCLQVGTSFHHIPSYSIISPDHFRHPPCPECMV